MKILLRHRPSPAMLVALTALVISVTGTAIAASNLVEGDKLIRKRSLSANRLRDHTVTQQQMNMKKLGVVPIAANARALRGIRAQAFAPVAYAHVSRDGVVDPAQSKGIRQSNLTRGDGGSYCFHGLPFTPKSGAVTIDFAGGLDGSAIAQLAIATSGHTIDCVGAERVEVATSSSPGKFEPEPFFVVLYG